MSSKTATKIYTDKSQRRMEKRAHNVYDNRDCDRINRMSALRSYDCNVV